MQDDVLNLPKLNADGIFKTSDHYGLGELHIKNDPETGLKAIIAIHNTKLGPTLGGCRFIEYSSNADALHDAMRLACGMSYKAAITNLAYGGGKSVILKPKVIENRESFFRSFGKFVNSLGGRYITAMDSGTSVTDMDIIAKETRYIASRTDDGDPSPSTALGIFRGIQAAVKFKFGRDDLTGLRVLVQGLGHVGAVLCGHLHDHGAKLIVFDRKSEMNQMAIDKWQAEIANPNKLYETDCDVFAPCALGAILDKHTIPQLKAKVIAGGANNQLAHINDGQLVHDRGILYAPDYAINAGGLIYATSRYEGISSEQFGPRIDAIYDTLMEIFDRSESEGIPTSTIADTIAQERLS